MVDPFAEKRRVFQKSLTLRDNHRAGSASMNITIVQIWQLKYVWLEACDAVYVTGLIPCLLRQGCELGTCLI
jgi:hypothetical protein